MSTYTVTMLTGAKPSTVAAAIVDLDDIVEMIQECIDDRWVPSEDEIRDRIDSHHPDDVKFKVIRTPSGGLGLAMAADSFTETDAMDVYEVVEPAVLA